MMIAPNSHARKEGKERGELKGEYGRIREEEGNADYGGMVQPSQNSALCCTFRIIIVLFCVWFNIFDCWCCYRDLLEIMYYILV